MPTPRGIRVLVVDHAPQVLKGLSTSLEQAGFSVQTSTSGSEALRLLRADPGRFDVVISKFAMRGMSGLEFADRARQTAPGLPVIVMTGVADDPGRYDEIIRKPFNPAAIIAMLETVVRAPERRGPGREEGGALIRQERRA